MYKNFSEIFGLKPLRVKWLIYLTKYIDKYCVLTRKNLDLSLLMFKKYELLLFIRVV